MHISYAYHHHMVCCVCMALLCIWMCNVYNVTEIVDAAAKYQKKKQNEQDRRCTSARARIQPPFKCNKKKKPHIHRTHIAFSSRNKNQQRNKCSEQQNKFLALNLSSAGMGLLKGHLSGFVVLPHRATAYICTYITAHGAQRTAFVYGKFIVCIPYSKMPDCWSAIALCSGCILRTVR